MVRKRWRIDDHESNDDGNPNFDNGGPAQSFDESQSNLDNGSGQFPGHNVLGNTAMEYEEGEGCMLQQVADLEGVQ